MDDLQRRVDDIRRKKEEEAIMERWRLDDIRRRGEEEAIMEGRRVDDIRRKKEKEAIAKQHRLEDMFLSYQAEAILALESVKFIEGVTDDMNLYEYAANKLSSNEIRFHIDKASFTAMLNEKSQITVDKQGSFLVSYLLEQIRATKNYQEYIEKESSRKVEEELLFRKRVIDEVNIQVKKFLLETVWGDGAAIYRVISHTFTELTVADWDTRSQKQFIMKMENGNWMHYKIHPHTNDVVFPYYADMPESFTEYFEEGKVPFCTKCPLCKSPTKFNYMKVCHNVGGGMGEQESNVFRQVYCDKHYFYDSPSNTHYIQDINGEEIFLKDLNMPNLIGPWNYMCWTPSIKMYTNYCNQPTKWKKWDPTDPDGKRAAAEIKEKERDEIKKQIAELYAKLLEI